MFDRAFRPWMRTRLHLRLAGLPHPDSVAGPLILVANHVSWWDGFVLREVHRALRPRAPLHTVMLEPELRRQPILRALGAVGIEPDRPATIARCVRVLQARIRRRPDSVVLFFPQGRIWPAHRRPLGFRRGIELFAERLPGAVLLPVALHLEPLQRVAPTAFALGGEVLEGGSGRATADRLEAAVARGLDRIHGFLDEHGEAAAELWPGEFQLLPGEP